MSRDTFLHRIGIVCWEPVGMMLNHVTVCVIGAINIQLHIVCSNPFSPNTISALFNHLV